MNEFDILNQQISKDDAAWLFLDINDNIDPKVDQINDRQHNPESKIYRIYGGTDCE
jgi:hypothetical protein